MQTSLPKLLAYPPVEGKIMVYKQNGTGRDTYIASNNGGYSKIQLGPRKQCFYNQIINFSNMQLRRSRSITITSKIQLYKADGTGRDNYIQLTNGGYTTPFSNQQNSDINFANTLRSYDRMAPIQTNDFFSLVQRRKSLRDFLKQKGQVEKQKELTARLSVSKKQIFDVRDRKRASTPWLGMMRTRRDQLNEGGLDI